MIWTERGCVNLLQTPPFTVEEVTLFDPSIQRNLDHKYYRLHAPSWVNVFAITKERQVVLVRQPRVGAMAMTLEVPGGCIDPEEDPMVAAGRELEEETGYRAGSLFRIGSISPNPAIMKNRLHMFLATDCFLPEQREHHPDITERIEIITMDLDSLDSTIESGLFENALGSLTVLMALRYHKDKLV